MKEVWFKPERKRGEKQKKIDVLFATTGSIMAERDRETVKFHWHRLDNILNGFNPSAKSKQLPLQFMKVNRQQILSNFALSCDEYASAPLGHREIQPSFPCQIG